MKTTRLSIFPSLTLFLTFLTLLFATAAQAQVPSYVPTNGLVGYWPFNGNANDESGNGNNGTVNGATLTADRFNNINSAINQTNNGSHIRTNNAINGAANNFTISFWANPTEPDIPINQGVTGGEGPGIMPIIHPAHGSTFGSMFSNAGVGVNMGNNQIQVLEHTHLYVGSPLVVSGNYSGWHNVVLVYDNHIPKLYIDGNYVATGLQSNIQYVHPSSGYCNVYPQSGFGCSFTPNGSPLGNYKGSFDDIGIWNRVLSDTEISQLFVLCSVTPVAIAGSNTPSAFANSTYTCNSNAGSTYTWAVNNGVIVSGQGTNSVTILWGAEGVGSVSVSETTADGCVGDAVIYDVDVQCVVSGNEITGPVGPEAFSNSTYTCNGAANSTYNWTVTNGVIASGQGTNTVNILWASTGLGNVSVVETTAEGCVGTTLSQDVVVIPTNVEELSNALILYPNPVISNLTLQVKNEMIGSDFVVFDALGKVVLRDKILSSNQNISINGLSNGNYILRVGEMNKVFTIQK
jgi:hypothetical protein